MSPHREVHYSAAGSLVFCHVHVLPDKRPCVVFTEARWRDHISLTSQHESLASVVGISI